MPSGMMAFYGVTEPVRASDIAAATEYLQE
jgi:hypothetical protein